MLTFVLLLLPTHLFPMHSHSTPWKYQKTLRFSDVFRRLRKDPLETNRLILNLPSGIYAFCYLFIDGLFSVNFPIGFPSPLPQMIEYLMIKSTSRFVWFWIPSLFYYLVNFMKMRNLYCFIFLSYHPAKIISSFSYENIMLKILLKNTFYLLRYTRVRYVKSLFTNIQKQQNILKISLLFRKFTNFTFK